MAPFRQGMLATARRTSLGPAHEPPPPSSESIRTQSRLPEGLPTTTPSSRQLAYPQVARSRALKICRGPHTHPFSTDEALEHPNRRLKHHAPRHAAWLEAGRLHAHVHATERVLHLETAPGGTRSSDPGQGCRSSVRIPDCSRRHVRSQAVNGASSGINEDVWHVRTRSSLRCCSLCAKRDALELSALVHRRRCSSACICRWPQVEPGAVEVLEVMQLVD